MDKIVLKAKLKPQGKTPKAIRREGLLPAVLYGKHYPSKAIVLDDHEMNLLIPRLSTSAIVQIDVEGDVQSALIREKQKDYLRNRLIHVDFQAVSMTEKLRTMVSIEFTGVAPAVKDFNGVVVHNITEVEVEALPGDLPERFVVDISVLANIGDSILVKTLHVSDDVVILHDHEDVIAVVSATREEPEEVVDGGELVEPELIEHGKREEEDEE